MSRFLKFDKKNLATYLVDGTYGYISDQNSNDSTRN